MKPKKSPKLAFLATSKVQPLGRIALGPAALLNLGVQIGDEIDIHFDPEAGILLLSKAQVEKARNKC
jgi:hypothetical protein